MMKVVSWLKENQCPICYDKLICIEIEESVSEVTDEGYLEPYFNTFNSFYDCKLYCSRCKKEFNATIENGVITRDKPYNTKKKEFNPFYGG